MQSLWDAVAVPYLTCWFTWTEKYVYACNIWNVDKCRRYLQVSDTLWLPPVLPNISDPSGHARGTAEGGL